MIRVYFSDESCIRLDMGENEFRAAWEDSPQPFIIGFQGGQTVYINKSRIAYALPIHEEAPNGH